MFKDHLTDLLENVRSGALSVGDAVQRLKTLPFEDLGFAKVDHHRSLRNGFPEVIYCEGKTTGQIVRIFKTLIGYEGTVLATRASTDNFKAVHALIPEAVYHEQAHCIVYRSSPEPVQYESAYSIAVVTAGTSDIPVAEEAAVTAEAFGMTVDRIYDVGVAGLHRLLAQLKRIRKASVIIVIAGMEGALASVVGGLVDHPVIAVPTSIGYGANLHGIAALLTMLNSCASGISTVNIDNGFGAAYSASLIIKEIMNGCQK
ncbi:MAG: nickel pincer cofactor biosynthesis protein LarB [Sporolactobacillus sp.]